MTFVAALALTLLSSPAAAQDDTAAARAAFARGQEAAAEERWSDALAGFQEAYMMSGVPVALYNQGMVLRALGRFRESRDAFDLLLREHPDFASAEEARATRDEVAARVAVMELVGLDPDAEYTIRLDGREVEAEPASEVEVEADPGEHTVEAEREGYVPFLAERRLRDGERIVVEVAMEEADTGRPIAQSPAFWIITVLVVGGAAAATGIILQNNAQAQPESGNVLNVSQELSR